MAPAWRSPRLPCTISRPCGNHWRRYVSTKNPRSSPCTSGSTTYTPAMTSDSVTLGIRQLLQFDRAVVAEHETRGTRPLTRATHLHVLSDQRVGQAGHASNRAVF